MCLAPPSNDVGHDWILAQVRIQAGGFKGSFRADFLARDVVKFRDELAVLHKDLEATASFETIEGQLLFTAQVDRLGTISIKGEARDEAGIGNKLVFGFEFDQSYLTHTIKQLNVVVDSFFHKAG